MHIGLTPMDRQGGGYRRRAACSVHRQGGSGDDPRRYAASTIHSLIYWVSEATPEEIARVEKELFDLQGTLNWMKPAERAFAETRSAVWQPRLADIHKPQFLLNDRVVVRDADLIVLDEVSMVGPEMAPTCWPFGKPILVLGDPGQLPPIKGEGAFTNVEPDVMLLTEIHRQAERERDPAASPTMARQGASISYGSHDDHVWKMRRSRHRARADAARRPGDLRTATPHASISTAR